MYEDGGCIDDFGGVPRHFTPPGAGGWDSKGSYSYFDEINCTNARLHSQPRIIPHHLL